MMPSFYNSRFKNTVIARIHPIIENTYLIRLEKQKQNLRFYIFLTSLFVVALAITPVFLHINKQKLYPGLNGILKL